MWLFTVPTSSMDALGMPAYLHNGIAYQASEPMCSCTINTEVCASTESRRDFPTVLLGCCSHSSSSLRAQCLSI